MENKNDIGKAFRDKLDGLQKQPRPAVWDAISADLDKNKKSSPAGWGAGAGLRTLLVVLALLFLGCIGYFLYPENTKSADGKQTGQGSQSDNTSGNTIVKKDTNANSNVPTSATATNNESNNQENGTINTSGNATGPGAVNQGTALSPESSSGKTGAQKDSEEEKGGKSVVATDKNTVAASKNNASNSSTGNLNSSHTIVRPNGKNGKTTAYGNSSASIAYGSNPSSVNSKKRGNANPTDSRNDVRANTPKNSTGTAGINGRTSDTTVSRGKTAGSPINKNAAKGTTVKRSSNSTPLAGSSTTGLTSAGKNSTGGKGETGTALKVGSTAGALVNKDNANSTTAKNNSTNKNSDNGIAETSRASGKNEKGDNKDGDDSYEGQDNSDITKTGNDGKKAPDKTKDTTPEERAICLADSLCIIKDTLGKTPAAAKEDKNTEDSNAANGYKQFFVSAHIAPTQYTLPKNTLLLDTLLNENKTTVDAKYNYGAYAGYNINSNWGVRAGVIVSGIEQTTYNALLQSNYVVVPGNDTDPNGYVHILPPANYSGIHYTHKSSNATITQLLGGQSDTTTVNLKQRLAFLEIPVSVQYNVFGTKLGMGITGGFGLLYVKKNNVYAENATGRLLLGNNKSIKSSGYTGSLGLQLYYKPLPAWQINIEPTFKYYFSAFSNATPYSLSVQAGLQYNFDLFESKK